MKRDSQDFLTFLRRSKAASLRAAALIAFVAAAAALAVAAAAGVWREVEALEASLALTIFLEPGANASQAETVRQTVSHLDGVDSVTIQSADDIQERFKERFQTTFTGLLPDNPFSPALVVRPLEGYRGADSLEALAERCKKLRLVNDAVFQERLARAAEKRKRETTVFCAVGGAVAAAAFALAIAAAFAPLRSFEATRLYGAAIALGGGIFGTLLVAGIGILLSPRVAWFAALPASYLAWTICGVTALSAIIGAFGILWNSTDEK